MSYQEFIIKALEKVSVVANRNFGKVSSVTKAGDNNQVLTETDLEIGKQLIEMITSTYPSHNVIDEEAGTIDNRSEFTWVVDPIDGTSNFANGVPMYGLMMGLLQGDIPVAGGIALPSFNEIYVAEKGKGTRCNGEPIMVSPEEDLMRCLVSYGIDGHQEDPDRTHTECALLAEIILSIRNLRSSNSVFDIAMVVRGRYGAMLNRTSKIWDNVGQQILIEEAGGTYTDFFGKELDYSDPMTKTDANFTFCAASPLLHKKLQKVIHTFSHIK